MQINLINFSTTKTKAMKLECYKSKKNDMSLEKLTWNFVLNFRAFYLKSTKFNFSLLQWSCSLLQWRCSFLQLLAASCSFLQLSTVKLQLLAASCRKLQLQTVNRSWSGQGLTQNTKANNNSLKRRYYQFNWSIF